MDSITQIFKALSDKNRVRILMALSIKELCVCEIKAVLEISISTVSSHLSILKEAGFIVDYKEGKWVNYSLNAKSTNPIIQQMLFALPMWLREDEGFLKDLEKINQVDRNLICCV